METVPMIAVPLHWLMFAGGILLGWVTLVIAVYLLKDKVGKGNPPEGKRPVPYAATDE